MTRQLASIQKISSLEVIPGADKIVLASMHGNGWKCITAIDNGIKTGDLVIYFEIDSRLPIIPAFSFMEKRHYKVKTLKMRGVTSQGLIMPLKDFPAIVDPIEGMDVTDIIGVTKIDTDEAGECSPTAKRQHPIDHFLCKFKLYRKIRPLIFRKKDKGWPSCIPHTDETRVQAIFRDLEPHLNSDKKWYVTTKIDGCLDENTILHTDKGLKTIKEICDTKYKGKVFGVNPTTNKIQLTRIKNTFINENKHEWYEITTKNGKIIKVTGNHKIYLPNSYCYRKVEDLKEGDILLEN